MSQLSGINRSPAVESTKNLTSLSKKEVREEIDSQGFKSALDRLQGLKSEKIINETGIENSTTQGPQIRFSNHAVERMRSRGISLGPELIAKLEKATQLAASKGAKETLVLTDESAMIVSVKNNTVVTVMDRNFMKNNVFTNIDSTVVI